MSIIYIISVILLYISFLFFKKSEEKLDLIKWIAIDLILLLSYNTFICYIFTTINIQIDLYTLTIINIIISIIINIFILKNKSQKYYFNKKDIISIIIVLFITLFFAYLNFGFPHKIKYIMTDSGVHYHATNIFYQTDSLLSKFDDYMMPGAYSNAGIWMKVFSPYMDFVDLYRVFISFDIFMFFMTGVLMFIALKDIIKSNYDYIISTIITIIYMIGYPLNVLLFGYFYLQLGILIFSTIVIVMQYFKEEIINSKYLILILFLLCFEMFFSYYLFVPAIYLALFIYYMYVFYKKNNKIINKDIIIYTTITLIIPAIIGIIYNVLPGIQCTEIIDPFNRISLEGYIYRNMYSNILLFIPFIILYLIRNKKEFNFNMIMLFILITYMCFLYLGCLYNLVSTYYFYKTYFILWFLVLYLFGIELIDIANKNKMCERFVNIYLSIYIIIGLLSLSFITVDITEDTQTHETILDVMEIYGLNRTILFDMLGAFTQEEMDILKYFNDNVVIDESTEILILGESKQKVWLWGIFNYTEKEPLHSIMKIDIKEWNSGKKFKYLVYFNRWYDIKEHVNLDKKVIYENLSGGILKNS